MRALELDWVYVAFPVPAGCGRDAVAAMRVMGIDGLSVTMPHKTDVAAAVDRLTATGEALGAVNTVGRVGGELVGDSTDGAGFLDSLRVDEGFEPEGCRCLVLGAGGAARALVLALAQAGAAEIVIANRTRAHAEEAAALAPGVARTGSAEHADDVDLVVNATPIGMSGHTMPIEPERLGPGQLVVDLVYHPPVTALVEAARSRGAAAVNGLGMLIHQAAHQFRLWTGEDPPLEVMSAAAAAEMARRG